MADVPTMADFYLYIRNGIEFPKNFNSKDRYLAMDLLMWGECQERPRKRVLKFISGVKKK